MSVSAVFEPAADVVKDDNDTPLVSIITIFLNAERFIAEAIDSVLTQTYQNWELLLVDDGSTDSSKDIALSYVENHPDRVRYLHHRNHQNRGMSASRNLGIGVARGTLIAFLDADDIWFPSKLEEQVAILSAQPDAAMVCGKIQWWHSWTGETQDAKRDFIPDLNVKSDTLVKSTELLVGLLQSESVTTTNGLIRREIIESVGGYDEGFRGMYEDQVFCTKICLAAPVFVAEKCWYKWRKHPDSACARAVSTGEYRSARLKFLKWLQRFLNQQGINDYDVRKTLKEEKLKCKYPAIFNLSRHIRYRVLQTKEQSKALLRKGLPEPLNRWIDDLRHNRSAIPRRQQPRKILVISAAFPPMHAGEADHTFHLCQRLTAQGLDVRLLTTQRESGPGDTRFEVHRSIRNWGWRDLFTLSIEVKRYSPDVILLFYIGWVYNHHPMITFAPTICKTLLPHTAFITQFANAIGANPEQFSWISRGLRRAVETWAGQSGSDYRYGTLLRDSDRVIVFSDLHCATLSRQFSGIDRKSVLIPPPPLMLIRPDERAARAEGRGTLQVDAGDFLIAYLGYIYPAKGIETLLEAFKIVVGERRNAKLVMIGGTLQGFTSYTEGVHKLSKEMRIDDRIIWTGDYSWDSDKASTYLRAADLFVMPVDIGVQMNNSSFAAAAAHGLPIIATRGSKLEEQFVHQENIYLCAPKDPEGMASAIKLLMKDAGLRERLAAGALMLAESWFSWERVVERTVEQLDQL